VSAKPKHEPHERQPRKTALITGVTGQDGSYLAELLLDKGYEVVGVVRRTSHDSYERIGHLLDRLHVVAADLLDQHSLTSVIRDAKPAEVYNLAAQSFVPTSWTQPVLTGEFTALGVTRILEAVRLAHPAARFYQASSSEMFGRVQRRQGLRTLDHGELSRILRAVRGERHPLQSRVAAARARVRDAQGHARRGAHRPRPGPRAAAR
jgi:GDP-D-mannose dehydratase